MVIVNKNILKLCIIAITIFCVPVFSKGWEQDAAGEWHYLDNDNNYMRNCIMASGASKFYLNGEGNIEKDYFLQDYQGYSYYFYTTGEMIRNSRVYIRTSTKSNKVINKNQYIYFDNRGRALVENGEYLSDSIEDNEEEKKEIRKLREKYLYLREGDNFMLGKYIVEYFDGFMHEEQLKWTILNQNSNLVVAYCNTPLYGSEMSKLHCDSTDFSLWLTNDFYNKAFSEMEKKLLTNDIFNQDKVFIINNSEYINMIDDSKKSNLYIGICLSTD